MDPGSAPLRGLSGMTLGLIAKLVRRMALGQASTLRHSRPPDDPCQLRRWVERAEDIAPVGIEPRAAEALEHGFIGMLPELRSLQRIGHQIGEAAAMAV